MQTVQHQTRMTRQRAVILEELRKLTTHPTADELYQIVRARMPRISLGTVYRNLCFLSDSGTILKLETPGNVKRFDGNVNPHQHIRCVSCGRVADVPGEVCLPDVQSMHVAGFSRVLSSRIEYDGICQACADCQPEENVCTPVTDMRKTAVRAVCAEQVKSICSEGWLPSGFSRDMGQPERTESR